jgi:hypothetical protein
MCLIQIKYAQIKFHIFGFWTVYEVGFPPFLSLTYTLPTTIPPPFPPFPPFFAYYICSARDWERSGLLEENPQSGCSDICASLKGPL